MDENGTARAEDLPAWQDPAGTARPRAVPSAMRSRTAAGAVRPV